MSYHDSKIDTLVNTLTGAWRFRVSAGAGWPGTSILCPRTHREIETKTTKKKSRRGRRIEKEEQEEEQKKQHR